MSINKLIFQINEAGKKEFNSVAFHIVASSTVLILLTSFLWVNKFSKVPVIFSIIMIPVILLFVVYLPLKNITKYSRMISAVIFSDNLVELTTISFLFYRTKKIIIYPDELKIKEELVNNDVVGITFSLKNNKYFLVKEYFDDYDKLIKHLKEIGFPKMVGV